MVENISVTLSAITLMLAVVALAAFGWHYFLYRERIATETLATNLESINEMLSITRNRLCRSPITEDGEAITRWIVIPQDAARTAHPYNKMIGLRSTVMLKNLNYVAVELNNNRAPLAKSRIQALENEMLKELKTEESLQFSQAANAAKRHKPGKPPQTK